MSDHLEVVEEFQGFNDHGSAGLAASHVGMIFDPFQKKLGVQKTQANTLHEFDNVDFSGFGRVVNPSIKYKATASFLLPTYRNMF